MRKIITVIIVLANCLCYSQEVTVEGNFNITEVAPSDTANNVLVWLEYGRVERYTIDELVLKYLSSLPNSTQWLLDMGESPVDMVNAGTPADSLLGRFYKGGYIIYLDTLDLYPNFEGLVAGVEDIGMASWGCQGEDLPEAEEEGIGVGDANTFYINLGCSQSGIAARLAVDWISNGYLDWYLPSLAELQLVRDVLYLNGISAFGTTGLSINYLTSEEKPPFADTECRILQFPTNLSAVSQKTQPGSVRAIRKF